MSGGSDPRRFAVSDGSPLFEVFDMKVMKYFQFIISPSQIIILTFSASDCRFIKKFFNHLATVFIIGHDFIHKQGSFLFVCV